MVHRPLSLLVWAVMASSCLASLSFDTNQVELHLSLQETNAVAVFPFINAGKKRVAIKSLKTSCVCTTASSAKNSYAPGARGKISVQYKPKERPTTSQKDILVETDDPALPLSGLKLRIIVPEPSPKESSSISWKLNEAPETKFFRIKINEPGGMMISKVTSSDPSISCILGVITPNKEYEILVTPSSTAHPMVATLVITASQNGNLKFIFITTSVGETQ
jgi:hypothetical protein